MARYYRLNTPAGHKNKDRFYSNVKFELFLLFTPACHLSEPAHAAAAKGGRIGGYSIAGSYQSYHLQQQQPHRRVKHRRLRSEQLPTTTAAARA